MRLLPIAALLTTALGLAGCGGGASLGSLGSVFGGAETKAAERPGPTRASASARAAAEEDDEDRAINCPRLQVLEGTSAYRQAARGSAGEEVAFQASLADLARECRVEGNRVILKVGVDGRVLIGRVGKPGTYSVPVRVVVKQGEKVVASRFRRVAVAVGESGVAPFTVVEEGIALPLTEADPADLYDVLVGFDANGPAADAPARRRR